MQYSYPKVEVVWEDALHTELLELGEELPSATYVYTMGYLVREDFDRVHVAQHVGDFDLRNIATIPRSLIRSISFVVYKQQADAQVIELLKEYEPAA